jgi:hypothetical protein
MASKEETADLEARGMVEGKVPDVAGAAPHTDAVTGLGLSGGGDTVQVFPEDGKVAETAKALNDAAEELGVVTRVQWTGDSFDVPAEVADKADLGGAQTVDVPAVTPPVATLTAHPGVPAGQGTPTGGDGPRTETAATTAPRKATAKTDK